MECWILFDFLRQSFNLVYCINCSRFAKISYSNLVTCFNWIKSEIFCNCDYFNFRMCDTFSISSRFAFTLVRSIWISSPQICDGINISLHPFTVLYNTKHVLYKSLFVTTFSLYLKHAETHVSHGFQPCSKLLSFVKLSMFC